MSYQEKPKKVYVGTKSKQTGVVVDGPPISGLYKGSLSEVTLELKIDVDVIRPYSQVLNVISGSAVIQGKGKSFPWLQNNPGLYFQSIEKPKVAKIPNAANGDTTVTSRIEITFSNGEKIDGKFEVLLRLPQDNGTWTGDVKLVFEGNETVVFESVHRTGGFFNEVALDVDYVEEVIWPTITLADFHDAPGDMKDRKLDVFNAFEDAGIKIHYNEKNSNKVSDPDPDTPWTKDEMYDVMMNHFQNVDRNLNVWCMIATKPPDQRYMGFSFSKDGSRGFGLFTGHKTFKGLKESNDRMEKAYASRRFLHYFVHEIGHCLGLVHPFQIGKPNALTWMNYAWKYDAKYGAGEFYENFGYSFTKDELKALRHNPSKSFTKASAADSVSNQYGQVKSQPSSTKEEQEEDSDSGVDSDLEGDLNLTIKIRPEPYKVAELVELEARLKNLGSVPTLIDTNLQPESGNLTIYVTTPDGEVKICESFMHFGDSSAMHKQQVLYGPGGAEGSDRYSELVQFGETKSGPLFNKVGKYTVSAVYNGDSHYVVSNSLEVNIKAGDPEKNSEANVAAILGGPNQRRFAKAQDYWKKIAKESLGEKRSKIQTLLAMTTGMVRENARETEAKQKLTKIKPAAKKEDLVQATNDLVKFYQEKGSKSDNMNYKKLVFARGKILVEDGKKDQANNEYNQLVADMVKRGVKYSVIKAAAEEWNSFFLTSVGADVVDAYSKQALQKKFEAILSWYPKKKIEDKPDLSGIGLGAPFNNFDPDSIRKAIKILRMVFNKYSETSDLNDVFDYADSLQKGFQVNHLVLQWAVEVFSVHSKAAKKAGIEYPLPKEMDKSLLQLAAIFDTSRTGAPSEPWMNYWRSDADLNFHHRHWHAVYAVGQWIGNQGWFGNWTNTNPELLRQGELFGYMHAQMLARYDAERESWGLRPVVAWEYSDNAPFGFNAGFEFHSDPQNSTFLPRLPGSWQVIQVRTFRRNTAAYRNAISQPFLDLPRGGRVRMDANMAGHILEASSSLWIQDFGSIHNQGHGVFGSMIRNPRLASYMSSTATAMRDPIFYRWHKHIDDLWQSWADRQVTELAEDAPSVEIRENDIIISRSAAPPNGFSSNWDATFESDDLRTYLGPAQKRFEWDNKITHEPFYYHIRFRRSRNSVGNLNLTVRIFICPSNRMTERKRWIEMDKFVYRLTGSESSATISRPDFHSSVIKRIASQMTGDIEAPFTTIQPGFCECGWPYNMLLPRGTAAGEPWTLCVFISDNNVDDIGIRSRCGSMSYCGASGAPYPDSRIMGYPFATGITINSRSMDIPAAMTTLNNAALSSFTITNDVTVQVPPGLVDVWSPYTQLRLNDGTDDNDRGPIDSFSRSRIRNVRMRVLIDDAAMINHEATSLRVRFQGRGPGDGSYRVRVAHIARRQGNTWSTRNPSYPVLVNNQSSFDVPEYGLVSDPVPLSTPSGDLFVTFRLETPGCFLRGSSRVSGISTYYVANPTASQETEDNFATFRGSVLLYCVSAIAVPL